MEKQDVKQLVNLYNEFIEKMNAIVYIGWGAHSDDFHAFKPYNDSITCLWNYDPNDGVDISEVPTHLLWSSNEEIADYFIEEVTKKSNHEIELANNEIAEQTKLIDECNTTIEKIKNIIDSGEYLDCIREGLDDLVSHAALRKSSHEIKVTLKRNLIEKIEKETSEQIKKIKERMCL